MEVVCSSTNPSVPNSKLAPKHALTSASTSDVARSVYCITKAAVSVHRGYFYRTMPACRRKAAGSFHWADLFKFCF